MSKGCIMQFLFWLFTWICQNYPLIEVSHFLVRYFVGGRGEDFWLSLQPWVFLMFIPFLALVEENSEQVIHIDFLTLFWHSYFDDRSHNLQCQRVFQVNAPVNCVCLHPNQVNLQINYLNLFVSTTCMLVFFSNWNAIIINNLYELTKWSSCRGFLCT